MFIIFSEARITAGNRKHERNVNAVSFFREDGIDVGKPRVC